MSVVVGKGEGNGFPGWKPVCRVHGQKRRFSVGERYKGSKRSWWSAVGGTVALFRGVACRREVRVVHAVAKVRGFRHGGCYMYMDWYC